MFLTYISDISVEKHLPYRISIALKLTLLSVFLELQFFSFFFFSSATVFQIFFCTMLRCFLHFLCFLAVLGFKVAGLNFKLMKNEYLILSHCRWIISTVNVCIKEIYRRTTLQTSGANTERKCCLKCLRVMKEC